MFPPLERSHLVLSAYVLKPLRTHFPSSLTFLRFACPGVTLVLFSSSALGIPSLSNPLSLFQHFFQFKPSPRLRSLWPLSVICAVLATSLGISPLVDFFFHFIAEPFRSEDSLVQFLLLSSSNR